MIHPWFKFWPSNWLADTQLRLCSLEIRGYLIDCLSIMHDAERRGYLETSTGKPITDEMLARLIGADKGDVYRCRLKVVEEKILSEEENTGILYSRKMVKDAEKASKCSKAGRKGGGNPAFASSPNSRPVADKKIKKKIEDRMIDDICPKGTFKGDLYTSDIPTVKKPKPKKEVKKVFESVPMQDAYDQWKQHRKEIRHKITPTQEPRLIAKMMKMGERRAIDSINFSIEMGYQGLIEPKADSKQTTNHKELPKGKAELSRGWID